MTKEYLKDVPTSKLIEALAGLLAIRDALDGNHIMCTVRPSEGGMCPNRGVVKLEGDGQWSCGMHV